MSIPSTGRSSNIPPNRGKSDGPEKDKRKDFKLPQKKESADEEKKKTLFELAADSVQQQLSSQQEATVDTAAETQAIEATCKVQAPEPLQHISRIIQEMVQDMHIGEADGISLAHMTLKENKDIPIAFSNSHLTLSYEANGLNIHFDNFMSPQQQNNAITLVEKNKHQLEQMIVALQSKNIQVGQLSIGSHTITLPKIEPLPPPFKPTAIQPVEKSAQGEATWRDPQKEKEHP